MAETKSSLADNFSITRGGPLHWLAVRLGLAGPEGGRVVRRAVLAVLLTWLPLVVLSFLQGEAYGSQIAIPFLKDIAANVRFLIAIPILILAETGIDRTWRLLVQQFLRSGLVVEKELASFEAVLESTTRLRDRALPEALLLAAAFFPAFFFKTEFLIGGVSNWHTTAMGPGALSLAGWWFILFSAPAFRFLMFRWLWRLLLVTALLWRVTGISLHLVATHTDMAAGLGFLSEGQKAFSPIVFAGGAVIAAQVGNAIAYQGVTLSSMKFPMFAYGGIAIIILVAPLLVVTPALIKIKKQALFEYGALVTVHNQLFDRKWIQKDHPADVVVLGNRDPSSLADLGSSFAVIRQMGIVPIDKPTLVSLALAAALPMVPVVLLSTPADDLIRLVLKMLG